MLGFEKGLHDGKAVVVASQLDFVGGGIGKSNLEGAFAGNDVPESGAESLPVLVFLGIGIVGDLPVGLLLFEFREKGVFARLDFKRLSPYDESQWTVAHVGDLKGGEGKGFLTVVENFDEVGFFGIIAGEEDEERFFDGWRNRNSAPDLEP